MKRVIHKIDATDKVLGRLASEIAVLLRGKDQVTWLPHIDTGAFVEISNVDKIKITGKKLLVNEYYRHSGQPGGLKTEKMADLFEKTPAKLLTLVVYNMLPKNKLRKDFIKRLQFVK